MPISYHKMLELFKVRGITSYTVKKYGIMGQSSWTQIQKGGNVDIKTIERVCRYLDCQPGDLLEYQKDKR